jgi:hypothetical protein
LQCSNAVLLCKNVRAGGVGYRYTNSGSKTIKDNHEE